MNDIFYITDLCGVFRDERKKVYNWPYVRRDFSSICYRYDGDTEFVSGGQKYAAKKGDVVIIPENVAYSQKINGYEKIVVAHFNANAFPYDNLTVIPAAEVPCVEDFFTDIYESFQKNGHKAGFETLSKLYMIFAQIEHGGRKHQPTLIERAGAIFDESYCDPDFSVGEWAEKLNISHTYLRKLYIETYGTSPCAYLQQRRLEYARELLDSGYFKISSVARMCGYYNPKRFSTAFSAHYGVSPQKYRGK